MIRPAVESDLRRIVEMSGRFYPYTSYWLYSQIPFNPEVAGMLALTMIDKGIMNVATNEAGEVVGMIGLVLIPFMFNPEFVHAGEIIWWVEPEYWDKGFGRDLLKSIEEPAKNSGARHIQMIDLANSTLSAGKLFESEGYILTERCWTKRVV